MIQFGAKIVEMGFMPQCEKRDFSPSLSFEFKMVIVLGAGYTGLTTAAELTLRGYKAHIIASDLGYRPPLTIVGTQSRRWPGSAISNTTFQHHDLLDRELQTLQRFMALSANQDSGL